MGLNHITVTYLQIWHLLWARSSLTFRQAIACGYYNSAMKRTVKRCWIFIFFAFYQFFCQCRVQHYYILNLTDNDVGKVVAVGSNHIAVTWTSDMVLALSKESFDIQANYRVWILQQRYKKVGEEMLDIYFLCLLSILLSMQGLTLLYTKFNR